MAYQNHRRTTIGDRAHRVYRQDETSGELTAIPRNKYSFTVSLDTIDGPVDLTRISNVQMPSFTYRTQTINRYNDKSVVQTGIDYTPITLTAYDNKDAKFEKFLKDYARHYFAGPMNDDDYGNWLVGEKGIKPTTDGHYIRSMTIARHDTKTLQNEIEIFHPFIANADADTLDYSDSSPTVFRVSFNYEGYRILSDAVPKPPVKAVSNQSQFEVANTSNLALDDKSGIYALDNEKDIIASHIRANSVTSNHPQLTPVEFGPGKRPSNVRGIDRPYHSEERKAREEEVADVIRNGTIVDRNYPYEPGKNKLVTYQGKTYMTTVS